MKKLTSIMAMLLMATTMLTFTSCNDDDEMADTLWGVWKGNIGIYYEDEGIMYDAAYSVISFDKDQNSYASGTGHWIDYFDRGPYSYYATNIEWRINNGVVTIYSIEDDEYWYISDYKLSNDVFRGTLDGERSRSMVFSLFKTAAPNWGDYDWDGWYGYSGYGAGYSKQQSRSADTKDSVPVRHIRGNSPLKQN